MDEPGPACPAVLRERVRNHRNVLEARVLGGPARGKRVEVEILGTARAPVERHRPRRALPQRGVDHRFDRRESGTRGDEHDRLFGFLAQEKSAEGSLEAQDVALLHGLEHVIGERAAGNVAHVQLDELVVVRRVRHRKASPGSILEQDVDVLPREEHQALVRRKLQVDDHRVVGRALELVHARRQLPHLDVPGLAHLARFDHHVRQQLRLAEERVPLLAFQGRERLLRVAAVVDPALDEPSLAAAAGAVAAAVRQHEPRIQRPLQDARSFLHPELVAGIADGDLMRHLGAE